MLTIEKGTTRVTGWEAALRGMRNPLESWDKSDSVFGTELIALGENDRVLCEKLAKAGSTHAKYRRMIMVTVDVTAPLYWWKEYDTYKVGTVANSCSTMHKIASRHFMLKDFSREHLSETSKDALDHTVAVLNRYRDAYEKSKDKNDWWQLIQLLPSSYNQKRTLLLNYENLSHIYNDRKDHKLDEWHTFCDWIKTLPYAEGIIIV